MNQSPRIPQYFPHIGKDYARGIQNDRYLFVGGHHPCLSSRRTKPYGCPITDISECNENNCPPYQRKEGCPLYEQCKNEMQDEEWKDKWRENKWHEKLCKKRINLYCETKYSIYDHVTNYKDRENIFIFDAFYKFWEKLKELNFYKFEDPKQNLFHQVSFCNYVQKITTNTDNNLQKIEAEYLDYDLNRRSFKEIYKNLNKPEVIVVLSFPEVKERIENLSLIKEDYEEIISEPRLYYVFAKKGCNLYKLLKANYLLGYDCFIRKAMEKGFVGGPIAACIAYHGKINRATLDEDLKKIYGLKAGNISRNCNKLGGYLKDPNSRNDKFKRCHELFEEICK